MIKLNTINKMTEELGRSLIGKHMHFTWHNKEDNTIEIMPGKVLDCKDNKITVDTMDIFMLDDDTSNKTNKMIKTFTIDDITDIFLFEDDEYNPDVLNMIKDIDESDYNKTRYDIYLGDATITTTIVDIDAPLTLTMNISGELCEFPLYFVRYIKKSNP